MQTGKSYTHLFFDLDHTLWDFDLNSRKTMNQVYESLGLEARTGVSPEAFYSVYHAHNERLWQRFRQGYIRRDELRWKRMWHTLLDFRIGDTALALQISEAYLELLPQQTALMPYTRELLMHCRERQYKLHLITNGFETTQWQKLRFSGIDMFFTEVITSERSHAPKPSPEIFSYALQLTGAEKAESIMIGDALDIDILGAFRAGWDQVYFNPERKVHDQRPTYEVDCLSRLLTLF